MVLQRDRAVPVWGSAAPGEEVTVRFAGQSVSTVSDEKGFWKTELAPLTCSFEGRVLEISGSDSFVALTNVLVGEVWLCSGQSNMQYSMKKLGLPEEVIAAAADYPLIRLFQAGLQTSPEKPQAAVRGEWAAYTPESAGDFSATASYFGRALNRELGVPVGLIQSAVGGTMIESWISRAALERIRFMQDRLLESEAMLARGERESQESYQQRMDEWRKARIAAKKARQRDPEKPNLFNPQGPHNPSALYNGMIAPLVPYAIRGVIWYQGESNESRPEEYHELLSALIHDWRGRWGQGDFPFLFVQLANFKPVQTEPNEGVLATWACLREQQERTLNVANTAMAVITDAGGFDIHPKDKKTVGERLALAARVKAYGENLVCSGPLFQSLEIKDGEAVVHFAQIGGGLTAKGRKLTGFAISGGDGKWHWADARISGNTVVLSAPNVPSPVAVRYNWANNPIGNLYNEEGLPASLFRTDF